MILKQQIIICQYIFFCGDSSITDLSKAVNLSVPTVTKLIGELIDEGFVHNFGGRIGDCWRPAAVSHLRLNSCRLFSSVWICARIRLGDGAQ